MRVLIGRTFRYDEEDMLFVKGNDYSVNKKLAGWIVRKRLGQIIPEIKTNGKGNRHLKDIKGPPKDKMMKEKERKNK